MRIKTIIPADGWRVVDAYLGFVGDVETAADEEMFEVVPVACFALITPEDPDEADYVAPVVVVDWPGFLYPENGDSPSDGRITLLGPGQELDARLVADIRKQAEREILKWRASRS